MKQFTTSELEAYLDEALDPEEMVDIENRLRDDALLTAQLVAINGRRDAGVHSLGGIWRRYRVGCPSREELGSYLLNVLGTVLAAHIKFHVDTIGCRMCRANIADMQQQTKEATGQRVLGVRLLGWMI